MNSGSDVSGTAGTATNRMRIEVAVAERPCSRVLRRRARLVVILSSIWICVPGIVLGVVREVPADHPTIQAAIDASASGDTVIVAPGTHTGVGNRDIEFRGRDIVLVSSAGAEQTTIDCQYAGRGFYIHEQETSAARIEGFTIRRGKAPADPLGRGGGISCRWASPTIVGCRIFENVAAEAAGVFLFLYGGVFRDCWVAGNTTTGGVGGGIYLGSQLFGGPYADIRNCVITGNVARSAGGVLLSGQTVARMSGCTVAGNSSTDGPAGIWSFQPLELDNCIVWGNCSSGFEFDELSNGGGPATLECCVIDSTEAHADFTFEECVFVDPEFCGPAPCGPGTGGDWTLKSSSPAASENSPCGEQIGALGVGCFVLDEGACCLAGGGCSLLDAESCSEVGGMYGGDLVPCEPDPCAVIAVEGTSWGAIKARYRPTGDR